MSKPGPKHVKKHNEGERINNSFTLIEEVIEKKNWKSEKNPKNEYLWKCKCECGEIFYARERALDKRVGCMNCTAYKVANKRSLKKYGVLNKAIKGRIFREYKEGARRRNLDFNLSFEDFIKLSESNCHYCGSKPVEHESDKKYQYKLAELWKRNGIDRVDTTKGYTLDNCVPCCTKCNVAKHDLKLDEFKEWIKRCYEHLLLEGKL